MVFLPQMKWAKKYLMYVYDLSNRKFTNYSKVFRKTGFRHLLDGLIEIPITFSDGYDRHYLFTVPKIHRIIELYSEFNQKHLQWANKSLQIFQENPELIPFFIIHFDSILENSDIDKIQSIFDFSELVKASKITWDFQKFGKSEGNMSPWMVSENEDMQRNVRLMELEDIEEFKSYVDVFGEVSRRYLKMGISKKGRKSATELVSDLLK